MAEIKPVVQAISLNEIQSTTTEIISPIRSPSTSIGNNDDIDIEFKRTRSGSTCSETVVIPESTLKRRPAVSAESDHDGQELFSPSHRTIIQKSKEARLRIKNAAESSFIFSSIEPEQKEIIFDSMIEFKVKSGDKLLLKGQWVISSLLSRMENSKYSEKKRRSITTIIVAVLVNYP